MLCASDCENKVATALQCCKSASRHMRTLRRNIERRCPLNSQRACPNSDITFFTVQWQCGVVSPNIKASSFGDNEDNENLNQIKQLSLCWLMGWDGP